MRAPESPGDARKALAAVANRRDRAALELDEVRIERDALIADVVARGLLSKAEAARLARVSRARLYPKY